MEWHVLVNLCKDIGRTVKISSFVLESEGKHIEVDFANRQMTYKFVISSTVAIEHFPEGYFDSHHVDLSFFESWKIKEQLKECIKKVPLKKELELLPPGASRKTYIRCVDAKGNQYYYTTEYLSESGFSVESIPVHKEYEAFYQFLLLQCDFPEFRPENRHAELGQKEELDSRYLDETIWICKACGSSNLMQHKWCVICGEDRGW